MGTAELGALLSTICMLFLALLTFVARGLISDTKDHDRRIATHETQLAVLQASQLHEKVQEHDVRLTAIENGLFEIKSDLRVVKVWVDNQTMRKDHND